MLAVNRRAFTLVEVLVVIAIIALLASILFPVFNRAKEQSRRVVCISNFGQGSRAILMYAVDNGDRCVPVESRGFGQVDSGLWNGPGDHDMSWPEMLQIYFRDWAVIRCPSDGSANDDGLAFEFDDKTSIPSTNSAKRRWVWGFRTNFGLNYNWLSYPSDCSTGGPPVNSRFGAVASPAKTILLIDSVWDRKSDGAPVFGGMWAVDAPVRPIGVACYLGGWRCWTQYSGDPDSPDCRADYLTWVGAYPRHTSSTIFTCAFTDGHVHGERQSDLLAGVDPQRELIVDADACIWDTLR
jgi:prepilin-type N-terminal cleavage/methylation domain-containing protein